VPGQPRLFDRIAGRISYFSGTSAAFIIAVLIVVVWGLVGPVFHFSSNWQLVINTGTTVVTFLMVFAIQSTQNRQDAATNVKLDELLRALSHARGDFMGMEEHMSEQEILSKRPSPDDAGGEGSG
jgi:low affinity Fe/Cu permease